MSIVAGQFNEGKHAEILSENLGHEWGSTDLRLKMA